ncbi:MAG: DUF3874 domain-containing protein [Bacteroidaceae bacterium]|nr:DUF3874 domain-containing protein [Bacteroidaceae bacterium]
MENEQARVMTPQKSTEQTLMLNKVQQKAVIFQRYMKERYSLRLNMLTGKVEFDDRISTGLGFRTIDDRRLNTMVMDARLSGIDVNDRDMKRYVHSMDVPDFDPVDDYLQRVKGKWDGKDHVGELASRIHTNDPQWADRFRIWIRGMVAQWQNKSHLYGNSVAPIIIGKQGWHKSTFCRQLLPPELGFAYTDQLNFGSKHDIDLTIKHYLLVNVDEFDQLTKRTQNGYLKNLLQRTDSKARKLFTDDVNEARRYASFIGTTNVTNLLTDPTGSRRFLCVELTAPIDTVTSIDHEQLYAQVLQELEEGKPYWFSDEEVDAIIEANQPYMDTSLTEHIFREYFRQPQNDQEGEWLSATQIFQLVKSQRDTLNMTVTTFGKYLSSLNLFPCKHSNKGNLYKVVLAA